jgi:ketosteroid isomerase-like protein
LNAGGPSPALARRVLDALGRGDVDEFAALLHPEVEIHTARGVRRGTDEAIAWARSTYDHLHRRYEIEEMHVAGERVLVVAQVQYVWRESGEIGDSAPVAIAVDAENGKLRRWRVFDDPAEGLKVFEHGVESPGDC